MMRRLFRLSDLPRQAVLLNGRVNGGWATITAHPMFGIGRWVIQIVPVSQRFVPLTIASGFDLRQEIDAAHRWIDERADEHGELQVAEYLESDEYREWDARVNTTRALLHSSPIDGIDVSSC